MDIFQDDIIISFSNGSVPYLPEWFHSTEQDIDQSQKKKKKKNRKNANGMMHQSQTNFKELFLSWSCIIIAIMDLLFVTKMLGGRFDYSMFYRLYILFILDKISRYSN